VESRTLFGKGEVGILNVRLGNRTLQGKEDGGDTVVCDNLSYNLLSYNLSYNLKYTVKYILNTY